MVASSLMAESVNTSPADESALVSVIMATYAGDSRQFLEQAVRSVLAQTHKHFEFLIVIDGPIGRDTQTFLDRITLNDDRIQVLPRPVNVGPAGARNHGIARAVGDYIAILDADDVALPERLEKQLVFLKRNNADAVGSFYRLIDLDGKVIGQREVPATGEGIRNSFCFFNPIANSTVLARAVVLKENPYPAHRFAEDYELWIRLARKGFTLLNQDEYLVLFRNDDRFVSRRIGWRFFQREVRCKLHALPLYPFYLAPVMIAIVGASSMVRLLPPALFRWLYAMRGSLR